MTNADRLERGRYALNDYALKTRGQELHNLTDAEAREVLADLLTDLRHQAPGMFDAAASVASVHYAAETGGVDDGTSWQH